MCLAIPGKITLLLEDAPPVRQGKVDFGGILKEVNLSLVPEAAVGDYVLVHVGFAISKIREEEAVRTLEVLRQLGDLQE